MKWCNDDIETLIQLTNSGLTYNEISILINRTKQSVRIKLNKLGIYLHTNDTLYEDVICVNCGKNFHTLKSEKRKFCSQSCSATKNNKITPKRKRKNVNIINTNIKYVNICLNCGKEILTRNKYCNNTCKSEYNKKIIYQKIEDGDVSLYHRRYKNYLIDKHGNKCMECGWDKINIITGNVPIELEHIDGNSENNLLINLKLLCPNCHSLTPTYKALNVGNGRHKRRERYNNGKSY